MIRVLVTPDSITDWVRKAAPGARLLYAAGTPPRDVRYRIAQLVAAGLGEPFVAMPRPGVVHSTLVRLASSRDEMPSTRTTRACAVPGCEKGVARTNRNGVCGLHSHVTPYCQCQQSGCRRAREKSRG